MTADLINECPNKLNSSSPSMFYLCGISLCIFFLVGLKIRSSVVYMHVHVQCNMTLLSKGIILSPPVISKSSVGSFSVTGRLN